MEGNKFSYFCRNGNDKNIFPYLSPPEFSTLIGRDSRDRALIGRDSQDRALIGRELYRAEIFSSYCYASSLMP